MTAVWAAMDVIKREPISGLDVSVEHVIGLFDGIAGIANTQVLSGLGMSPVAINAHNMERLYNPAVSSLTSRSTASMRLSLLSTCPAG